MFHLLKMCKRFTRNDIDFILITFQRNGFDLVLKSFYKSVFNDFVPTMQVMKMSLK
jgi:hypothetical protein